MNSYFPVVHTKKSHLPPARFCMPEWFFPPFQKSFSALQAAPQPELKDRCQASQALETIRLHAEIQSSDPDISQLPGRTTHCQEFSRSLLLLYGCPKSRQRFFCLYFALPPASIRYRFSPLSGILLFVVLHFQSVFLSVLRLHSKHSFLSFCIVSQEQMFYKRFFEHIFFLSVSIYLQSCPAAILFILR